MRSIILFYYQCHLRTNNNQTSCHKSSVKSGSYSEASVKTKIMEIIELPLQVQRYLMNTIIIFNCHPRRRFRRKKKNQQTNWFLLFSILLQQVVEIRYDFPDDEPRPVDKKKLNNVGMSPSIITKKKYSGNFILLDYNSNKNI